MGSEWREVELNEVASEITVGHVGSMADEYVDTGIPMLRSLNVEPLRINPKDLKYIPREFHQKLQKSQLRPGDVVIVRTGKPGACAVIPEWLKDCNCSDLVIVRCGPDLHNRFLSYYINTTAQNHITAHLVGAVQQHFNVGSAKKLLLRLPPIAEQKRIAGILGALDDKIELNREMNETLEQMAKALFKSWFVDFDPVHAKADGRQPFGMDKATADLFPDSFVNSELGKIPKGWEVSELGQIADVIDCLHAKKPEASETGQLYLQLNNIRDDGLIDISETFLIGPEDYKKWTSRMEATEGDCVITNVGRVGAVAQIPQGMKAALGRNITGIRCKPIFTNPTFLIECLMSEAMREEIRRKTDTGTILDALNVKSIPKLRFIKPPLTIAESFERLARPLRHQMERGVSQSGTLADLRDTLLPKLLSGDTTKTSHK
jgi:type I restriction enzyme S subunit